MGVLLLMMSDRGQQRSLTIFSFHFNPRFTTETAVVLDQVTIGLLCFCGRVNIDFLTADIVSVRAHFKWTSNWGAAETKNALEICEPFCSHLAHLDGTSCAHQPANEAKTSAQQNTTIKKKQRQLVSMFASKQKRLTCTLFTHIGFIDRQSRLHCWYTRYPDDTLIDLTRPINDDWLIYKFELFFYYQGQIVLFPVDNEAVDVPLVQNLGILSFFFLCRANKVTKGVFTPGKSSLVWCLWSELKYNVSFFDLVRFLLLLRFSLIASLRI